MQLRDYQIELEDMARNAVISGHRHVICYLPTGGGKTAVFGHITKCANDLGKKVLICTDRTELIGQSSDTIEKCGIKPYLIQAGADSVNDNYLCYVAMSQTLKRDRVGKKEYWDNFIKSVDLIIIDECHKQEFNYLFTSGLLKDKDVLGFTATPERRGKMRQLGLDYSQIVKVKTVKGLIVDGYLNNAEHYQCSAPNTDGVAINRLTGDFDSRQLFSRFDNRKMYSGVISNYKSICDNTRFICFCVNSLHAIKTAVDFSEAGYNVKFLLSGKKEPKLPLNPTDGQLAIYNDKLIAYEMYKQYYPILSGDREQIIKDFKIGKITGIINVDICTTGFDAPATETIILNFKTLSKNRYLQAVGRGARIADGKTHFNILDFGDNQKVHGYYDDNHNWSLWHDEGTQGGGVPPLKECEGCMRIILASYKICPFCGFKKKEQQLKEIELKLAVRLGLQEKYASDVKPVVRIKDMTYEQLLEHKEGKGYKQPWLWKMLWIRGGERELLTFAGRYGWKTTTIETAKNYCKTL